LFDTCFDYKYYSLMQSRAFTPLHWITVLVITLIWLGAGMFFAEIFVTDYPQYRALGYGSAVATAIVIGLIHLGWLAIFRGRAAVLGMIIAKLCAIPITIGGGFFAIAMGAMGADSGVENAAKAINMLLPFCIGIAATPTTLAALLGAGIGYAIGRSNKSTTTVQPAGYTQAE
jgi:hypothetical protein